MKTITRLATTVAVAAVALGGAATGASANFTGAGTSGHGVTAVTPQRFSIDANHYWVCTGVTVPGGMSVSSDGTALTGTPTYTGCTWYMAGPHPASYTGTADWSYSGSSTSGLLNTGGTLALRFGSCEFSIAPTANFAVTYSNGGSNLNISSSATGLAYTTSRDCRAFGYPTQGTTAAYTGTLRVAGVNAS